uniref:non-specific serine/threonine protein kinase n=1 Tax=Glycine max TaxID=3847 RepID=Q9S9D3_SOYBN|nr:GmPK4=protein kinase [Glycine max L.=soybeans, Peptide, 101 aa] [Glycine max]
DLKPENVLVRSDGHIMLSDFDLSLCSDAIPAVESPDCSLDPAFAPALRYTRQYSSPPSPASRTAYSGPGRSDPPTQPPLRGRTGGARSCSFVGTHEYLAPE